jgi:hypothetical protein
LGWLKLEMQLTVPSQVTTSLANCEHVVSEKQIQAFAAYLDGDAVRRLSYSKE